MAPSVAPPGQAARLSRKRVVSKTGGWGFESLRPCDESRAAATLVEVERIVVEGIARLRRGKRLKDVRLR